jgi:hypothetical protein
LTTQSAHTVSRLDFGEMKLDNCTEVFVGGGWAGVYSLYRRVMDDPSRASSACLMEASWRIGGRTYSVPINHTATPFVQDVGAYRFSPDMHMVGDLILEQLQLPTECYQASCPSAADDFPKPFMFNYSAPLRRIVDPETKLPSGYATAMHRMIEEMQEMGARVFTQTKLIQFELMDQTMSDDRKNPYVQLSFQHTASGMIETIPSSAKVNPIDLVVLNLPRNHLFEVKGVQESLSEQSKQTIGCIVFDTPAELFGDEIQKEVQSAQHYTTNLGKAYLFYENAFWRTKLNETVGTWPPDVGFAATLTPEGVRLNVRWHDGPVRCKGGDSNDSNNHGTFCMGLLETYYSVSNETFYSSLPTSYDEPLGSVWETDGPGAQAVLQQAHTALVHSLKPLLEKYGIDGDSLPPPSGLIVGIWHRPTEEYPLGRGYTAPTKVLYYPTESGLPDQACNVPGLTEETYRDVVLRPWKEIDIVEVGSHYGNINNDKAPNSIRDRIFLVNNDFSCLDVRYYWGDWAEESLLQAERAMLLLGMSPPSWLLNKDYYHTNVVMNVKYYVSLEDMLLPTSNATSLLLKWILLPFALVVAVVALFCAIKSRRENKRQAQYDLIP